MEPIAPDAPVQAEPVTDLAAAAAAAAAPVEAPAPVAAAPVAPPPAPAPAAAAPVAAEPSVEQVAALVQSPAVQAAIAAAVEQRVAAAPVAPDGAAADPRKPSILEALHTLAQEAEHSTFAERVEALAANGYQTIVKAEHERPMLGTLLTIVEALVDKAVIA